MRETLYERTEERIAVKKEVTIIRKIKVKTLLFLGLLIVGLIIITIVFLNSRPLIFTGFTEYDNDRKTVDIELVNQGRFNIELQEIFMNNKSDKTVKLVLSYSAQLVGGGIDSSPTAKFVGIQDEVIRPQLPPDRIQEESYNKERPIHYGLRIVNQERVTEIKIKYRYLGFPRTEIINLDTWPE